MTTLPYSDRPLFRPGPRTLNWMIPLGMGAVGWALSRPARPTRR